MIRRPWFILSLIIALIAPLPALADAHPGLHVNPHIPNVVLLAAIGFVVLAWASMVGYLLFRRYQRRRLIEDRLDLRTPRRSLRDLKAGRTRLVSHDEVRRRLGLDRD